MHPGGIKRGGSAGRKAEPNMKVLLDTCVIIDYLQKREPFHVDANAVMTLAANERLQAYTTAKAVTDIYYLIHRSVHDDQKTRAILSALLSLLQVLDSAGIDCQNALSSAIHDYEDAVMAETAFRSGMDCIVSRNSRDYTQAKLPVYTPGEFLRLFHSESIPCF